MCVVGYSLPPYFSKTGSVAEPEVCWLNCWSADSELPLVSVCPTWISWHMLSAWLSVIAEDLNSCLLSKCCYPLGRLSVPLRNVLNYYWWGDGLCWRVQWLRTYVGVPKDFGVILSIFRMAHNHLLQSSSGLPRHQACMWYTDKTLIYKIELINF